MSSDPTTTVVNDVEIFREDLSAQKEDSTATTDPTPTASKEEAKTEVSSGVDTDSVPEKEAITEQEDEERPPTPPDNPARGGVRKPVVSKPRPIKPPR